MINTVGITGSSAVAAAVRVAMRSRGSVVVSLAPMRPVPKFQRLFFMPSLRPFSVQEKKQQQQKEQLKQTKRAVKIKQSVDRAAQKVDKLAKNLHQIKEEKEEEKALSPRENIYTVPNMLTATRLVLSPVIGYFIVKHQIGIALPLFVYCCVTDFIDGYIARKYQLKTIVGSIIDPMADKLLMVITTVALAASEYHFPVYLAVLILGKDILLGLSAVYIRYYTLPKPKTFKRYWDFSIPSVKVSPTTISKYNTGFQMVYITLAIFQPVIVPYLHDPGLFDAIFEWYGYFVGATTVLAGGSYLFVKGAVKRV